MNTRNFVIAFTALTALAGPAHAEWPSTTITMVVPFPAGGTTDLITRPIAQKLSEVLKQPVIVDNRGGAGGTIGAAAVAKAAPDGNMLLVGAVHHTIATSLYKKLPYDFEKDLTPVTVLAFVPNILVVHPAFEAKSVKDVISMAKAKAGGLTYGSAGNGTSHHMAGELFKSMAGVDIQHVPYKGGAPMMTDLIGGSINMAFETSASATPQIKSGKVRPLAITTAKRSPSFPDLPTVAEAGVPGYEVLTWYAVLAPKGTPKEIVARLHSEILKILQTSDIKQRLADIGAEPGGITPEQFAQLIRAETVKWAKVVKDSGATVD
ncbi:MAG: tripartite tricarboxylate transporter substrate binding protein [Burkholderiales bacterium]